MREIIEQRIELYESDPGYRLAKLLSESYCLYGDAYAYQNNSDNAYGLACCLYENSIWWEFECLEYDVAPENFAKNLRNIEERYDKIELITARGSEERIRAERLSNAFARIALEIERDIE